MSCLFFGFCFVVDLFGRGLLGGRHSLHTSTYVVSTALVWLGEYKIAFVINIVPLT